MSTLIPQIQTVIDKNCALVPIVQSHVFRNLNQCRLLQICELIYVSDFNGTRMPLDNRFVYISFFYLDQFFLNRADRTGPQKYN